MSTHTVRGAAYHLIWFLFVKLQTWPSHTHFLVGAVWVIESWRLTSRPISTERLTNDGWHWSVGTTATRDLRPPPPSKIWTPNSTTKLKWRDLVMQLTLLALESFAVSQSNTKFSQYFNFLVRSTVLSARERCKWRSEPWVVHHELLGDATTWEQTDRVRTSDADDLLSVAGALPFPRCFEWNGKCSILWNQRC